MAIDSILVSDRTRYKDTELYRNDADDRSPLGFGLFEVPEEFPVEASSDDRYYTITSKDIGNFDGLAARFFGVRYEDMWWVIALYNSVIDEEVDLSPGDTIRIPTRSRVNEFLSRAGIQR